MNTFFLLTVSIRILVSWLLSWRINILSNVDGLMKVGGQFECVKEDGLQPNLTVFCSYDSDFQKFSFYSLDNAFYLRAIHYLRPSILGLLIKTDQFQFFIPSNRPSTLTQFKLARLSMSTLHNIDLIIKWIRITVSVLLFSVLVIQWPDHFFTQKQTESGF